MSKKLTGKALARFESKRNMWQEVLDGVREIKLTILTQARLWLVPLARP